MSKHVSFINSFEMNCKALQDVMGYLPENGPVKVIDLINSDGENMRIVSQPGKYISSQLFDFLSEGRLEFIINESNHHKVVEFFAELWDSEESHPTIDFLRSPNIHVMISLYDDNLKSVIENAWENKGSIDSGLKDGDIRNAVGSAIFGLDVGVFRVAEKIHDEWVVNQWLKKAVLLSFKINSNIIISGGPGGTAWFDKVFSKFYGWDEKSFQQAGFRAVPPCAVRRGSFIAPNVVLMPSYVNIGAYVDSGTMIDTWATVGSCAQIGKNVHVSGGAGIGGVLEPLQANPTIIEDNCFIGARSEIVEGVVVEEGSVISMGVFIGQSTKIFNRMTNEITFGRVPAGSVVVPGSLPAKNGSHSLNCAVIIKQVDERTRSKTSINELLRD